MTKERLEELMEQRGTIYIIFPECNFVKETKLNNCRFGIKNNELTELCLKNVDTYEMWRLHETREQAEWHLKNDAERTERFDPPMWEDIENTYQFKFVVKYGKVQEFYTFDIRKDLKDDWAITIDNGGIIFESEPTKENYIKACEIVRDLFNKGGAK